MLKDWESKKCVGECPKCGKSNLDYGVSEGLDDSRIYPFTCNDCGATGREVYIEKYAETEWEVDEKPEEIDSAYEQALADNQIEFKR